MERDRDGHRGVKRSGQHQFGCKSCHVSHPVSFPPCSGKATTTLPPSLPPSRNIDKREKYRLSLSRKEEELARNWRRERKEEGEREKKRGGRKEGNTDKRPLKRNYAGRTKKGATSRRGRRKKNIATCSKTRGRPEGSGPVIASAAARGARPAPKRNNSRDGKTKGWSGENPKYE